MREGTSRLQEPSPRLQRPSGPEWPSPDRLRSHAQAHEYLVPWQRSVVCRLSVFGWARCQMCLSIVVCSTAHAMHAVPHVWLGLLAGMGLLRSGPRPCCAGTMRAASVNWATSAARGPRHRPVSTSGEVPGTEREWPTWSQFLGKFRMLNKDVRIQPQNGPTRLCYCKAYCDARCSVRLLDRAIHRLSITENLQIHSVFLRLPPRPGPSGWPGRPGASVRGSVCGAGVRGTGIHGTAVHGPDGADGNVRGTSIFTTAHDTDLHDGCGATAPRADLAAAAAATWSRRVMVLSSFPGCGQDGTGPVVRVQLYSPLHRFWRCTPTASAGKVVLPPNRRSQGQGDLVDSVLGDFRVSPAAARSLLSPGPAFFQPRIRSRVQLQNAARNQCTRRSSGRGLQRSAAIVESSCVWKHCRAYSTSLQLYDMISFSCVGGRGWKPQIQCPKSVRARLRQAPRQPPQPRQPRQRRLPRLPRLLRLLRLPSQPRMLCQQRVQCQPPPPSAHT